MTTEEPAGLVQQAQNALEQLQSLMDALVAAKSQGSDCRQLEADINSTVVVLKLLNRQIHEQLNRLKESSSVEKEKVDDLLLKEQNIWYRNRHLSQEIDSCKSYEPLEQLLDIQEPPGPERNHADDLRRLEAEKQQRLHLYLKRRELQTARLKLLDENKKKKSELERLDALFVDFIKSSEPIQALLEKY